MNISVETYGEPFYRYFDADNTAKMEYEVDFAMHRIGRAGNTNHETWELIMAGKTKSIQFREYNDKKYIQITYDISKCLVHRPEEFLDSKDDTTYDDANYVNFQLGNIFRY